MSDTLRKYWDKMEDSSPENQKKLLQQLFDSDPNYNGELDDPDKQPKLNKTVYRILAEYDEDDVLAAAELLMFQKLRKNDELKWE